MDKRFLDKVLNQIVRETEIDYDEGRIYTPFHLSSLSSFHYHHPFPLPPFFSRFSQHCKWVYGLNDDEIGYVWVKYKDIIKNKIDE
jgi:hypothetical protein